MNEATARGPLAMRSYRAGDEMRVVALWNHAYAHYAGLAARNNEHDVVGTVPFRHQLIVRGGRDRRAQL